MSIPEKKHIKLFLFLFFIIRRFNIADTTQYVGELTIICNVVFLDNEIQM